MDAVELAVTVANRRDLAAWDLTPYDAVYLGNPYCRHYAGNLLEHPEELRRAIREVRGRGRRAYLTTYAAPRQDALPVLRRALAIAAEEGAAAVEVHALGLLRLVREEVPALPVHVGSFANVFTDLGVDVLRRCGVARVSPHPELPLEEVDALGRTGGVPLEVVVHGKVPLGVSDTCLLLPHEASWGVGCPDLCRLEVFLEREGWVLKSVGKGILSGRDLCLLEHLPRLLRAGHRHFRVEAVSEPPAYGGAVGAVYREALGRALAGDDHIEPRWWETLGAHVRHGFANGFAFGRSGAAYRAAGAARPEIPPPTGQETGR